MKKIFLMSSSKYLSKALKSLNKPLNEIKLAHIVTASKKVDDLGYIERTKNVLESLGVQYEDIDIAKKNENELEKMLSNKDVIFVNGGNTFYLLKAIRESGFGSVVKKLLKKGVVYIGASAGSYVACPNIKTSTWTKDHKDLCGITDYTAMNLVPFVLKVHYTSNKKKMIEKKRKTLGKPLEILTDEQAILVEDDKYRKLP